MQETFPGGVISSRGGINWQPKSCDFRLLCGAGKPPTLKHLNANIRQAMSEIPSNMCEKVIENYLKTINTSRVGDVVFHT